MKTQPQPTSYDEVPYESHPFPQTHPDRLATIAALLGLRPAAVERCRVLELGCAAGGNVIPMAATLSDSTFLGIDLSRVEIDEGLKLIADLELKNIELKHLSITDVDDDFGKFDYIICHGVYSWVPAAVQDKILDICKRNLAPRGIAYVSYNTYPGWHMRGMIRDMLVYHTKQFAEAKVRVRQARNFLDFLSKTAAREATPYSLLLKNELQSFQRSSDSYLYHEHLEEINEPIYFHEFAGKAAAKGLKYLAETDLRVMVPSNYPPEIANVIQMLAHDNIHMEQYLDFVRNTMFRQSLLCHEEEQPNYNLDSGAMDRFLVACPARRKEWEKGSGGEGEMIFEGRDGVTLSARDAIVQEAMLDLSERWPVAVRFDEVFREAQKRVKERGGDTTEKDRQLLAQTLLNCYVSGSTNLIELHVHQPQMAANASGKPCASDLARRQAGTGNRVTSLRHETVVLGDVERFVLRQLDGTRDRAAILARLQEAADEGEVSLELDGDVTQMFEEQIQAMTRNGLLLS